MLYLLIFDNYSHMARVNTAMAQDLEWIEFQKAIDAQQNSAATLKLSGIAQMAGSY